DGLLHRHARPQVGHGEQEHRNRAGKAEPEPAAHVRQLGVLVPGSNRARLEGHAADRARPWFGPHDLRVHRAGPLDEPRLARGPRLVPLPDIPCGLALELLQAAATAEAVLATFVDQLAALRIIEVHGHAADGVLARTRRAGSVFHMPLM